jgi:hypothetical protein
MAGKESVQRGKRLRTQEYRLAEQMMNLPKGASELSEDLITTMVETEDLRNELEFLQNFDER